MRGKTEREEKKIFPPTHVHTHTQRVGVCIPLIHCGIVTSGEEPGIMGEEVNSEGKLSLVPSPGRTGKQDVNTLIPSRAAVLAKDRFRLEICLFKNIIVESLSKVLPCFTLAY